jgi:hypothetical protein
MESSLVQMLFDEGIYIIEEENTSDKSIEVVEPSEEFTFDIHGNENSKVLCLIDDDSSKSLTLLQNIMKAVKLEEKDYAWSLNKMSSNQVKENFKMVFNFNNMPDLSKEHSVSNEIFNIDNRRQLNTHGLLDLQNDIEKKKPLWATLEQMINKA